MTFASLLLEIRRRAPALPDTGGRSEEFDAALREQMTPELVVRLDMIASELLELGRTNEGGAGVA